MALITKIKTIYSEVVAALGFTPENAANKGQPNGYAGLDAGGRVPSGQLPSYVDDVLEFANLASFPNPGTAGVIYLALDTNLIYRWSGSTYLEIASGDVDWSNITNKPAFGTMSTQNATNVSITGGTGNFTSIISGNLSLVGDAITTTEASGDIVITPTGVGAVSVGNRATVNGLLSLGSSDNGGTYLGKNAEYIESGFLSAWRYLDTGAASRMDIDNGSGLTILNAPSGNAGDLVTTWNETFNITSAGDVVAGNWAAGVVNSTYGGTGVNNAGKTLTLTANATVSGINTGDQTDITGNAGTATKLQTARTINGVPFDGTQNINISALINLQALTINGPLTGGTYDGSAAVTIGIQTANGTQAGALSSTDWTTFNSKQNALTGSGLVKSTNGTISYITDNSTQWQAAYNRRITDILVTGVETKTISLLRADSTTVETTWQLDTITVAGDANGSGKTSINLTLANTNVTAGVYGNATQVPQITIDEKGRATSAANITITPAWSSVTGKPTTVAGYGITDAVTDAEYTASDVLTKIKTVDGLNSGLDADTLRGVTLLDPVTGGNPAWPSVVTIRDTGVTELGRYIDFHTAASDANNYSIRLDSGTSTTARVFTFPTTAGELVATNNANQVTNAMLATITTAGKVSNSATTATNLNTSSAIVARDAAGAFAAGAITVTSLTATGDITAYSDERLKSEWQALPNDFIEKVAQVKCGIFERTDIDLRQAGTSAQDWMEVLPEVVAMADDGLLSLAYGNAALVTVIELCKRIVQLEERIKALEAK
jgi:hypothetical protein